MKVLVSNADADRRGTIFLAASYSRRLSWSDENIHVVRESGEDREAEAH